MLVGARDVQVGVLTGLEVELAGLDRLEPKRHDVAGHGFDAQHLGADVLNRDPTEEFVLVEVEQLDGAVTERTRAAQQHEPVVDLRVVAGEGGVVLHLNLAVENVGLAGRTAAFAAPVHEVDALTEGGVQNVLVLADVHLEVHRVEGDLVRIHVFLSGDFGVIGASQGDQSRRNRVG